MTWLPLFFGFHACLPDRNQSGLMKKPKRELDTGELKWQTQKGWNMTPTIVGFCPWLASVMGLYGLTVTMRIHQLLTIRKISNHLNHLLIIFSSGWVLEQQQQKGLNSEDAIINMHQNLYYCFHYSKPSIFNWSGQLSGRGRAYGATTVEWILCWWSQIITQSGPKWSPSDSQSGS